MPQHPVLANFFCSKRPQWRSQDDPAFFYKLTFGCLHRLFAALYRPFDELLACAWMAKRQDFRTFRRLPDDDWAGFFYGLSKRHNPLLSVMGLLPDPPAGAENPPDDRKAGPSKERDGEE